MTAPFVDLYVTTPTLQRTRIDEVPYDVEVSCTRMHGWLRWNHGRVALLGGQKSGPDYWLVLDVGGQPIVDTRPHS